jgi:aspartate carbamoyltransferase catalytic subunit
LRRKDLLTCEHLPIETLVHFLGRSDHYFQLLNAPGPFKKLKLLEGRTIANLFFENSTRTKISFELAERRLGADTVMLSNSGSSLAKGESILDTVKVLEAMKLDAIVVRHSVSGVPEFLARHLPAHVRMINAGDGAHEHPTQALLDVAELRVALGDLKGKRIAIVGDIAHSRVARSNIWLLKKLGAEVVLAGPSTLMPRMASEVFGVEVCTEVETAISGADAVIALRIQLERQARGFFPSIEEYRERYGLTARSWKQNPPFILHPGPVNLGTELDFETAYCERSLILRQVKRGVAVRMAVLEWMFTDSI